MLFIYPYAVQAAQSTHGILGIRKVLGKYTKSLVIPKWGEYVSRAAAETYVSFTEVYLEPYQRSVIDLFLQKSLRLKDVNYFHKEIHHEYLTEF